ncbi:MAG: hypothetical protein WCY62_09740 [Clostridia bacterium]|jgi:hypothetical protein
MKNIKAKTTLVISFLIALTATVMFSPIFAIKEVNINVKDPDRSGMIYDSLSFEVGDNLNLLILTDGNIFNGHITKAEEQLVFSDRYIKTASVMSAAKDIISVTCEVRDKNVRFNNGDLIMYCDYDGTILEISREINENMPLLLGIEINKYYLGYNISTCNDRYISGTDICSEIERYDKSMYTAFRSGITSVDLSEQEKITIKYDNRIDIYIDLTKDVIYQANMMCSILSGINQNLEGHIDFTISGDPYFTPNN